ncbi:4-hydroxy-tetrahydrodipicolinate reductase [Bdellovibrio svalbardensis]|uniref:4-hydroxy-tetrahydrodipicolinate reductase n=1 Tax=Bdellovibrio svalbardensis TaxID=2972972 RepID=A0ABT6DG80_9BACT|nr:dihydrodipicolinate reductase C-terminal domain-containing protein [Bdellovibrio svalbardensis]MDG0814876.1 4-hydroxy-tetrahydrodipicolinate reductase [Bdellovibrio svalbardensis]
MKKLKIGLVGAGGRMGKEIASVLEQGADCELFYPLLRDEKVDPKKASKVDVWIDFSTPEAFAGVLKMAAKYNTPVVCGTTGFTAKEKALLKKYGSKIPLLWASNMSMGVAVLNEALKSLSAISNFDFQIEEIHHNRKKDKPSGTAITLQENLVKAVGKTIPEPLAIRGGGVFGVHKIFAMSDEEVLTFEHSALNRTVFAKGAVRAASWLAKQKPGLYQIRDVLFGKKA